jgi:hypothetical protein
VRRFFQTLLAILREISDEAPYQRHLAANGLKHSPEEWRRFSDHLFAHKYARGKCC